MRTVPRASARASAGSALRSWAVRDPATRSPSAARRLGRLGPWALAALGVTAAIAASVATPAAALAAAGQDWSPFVPVAGPRSPSINDWNVFDGRGQRLSGGVGAPGGI